MTNPQILVQSNLINNKSKASNEINNLKAKIIKKANNKPKDKRIHSCRVDADSRQQTFIKW